MQTRQKRKAVGSNPSDGPMLLSDLPEEILYYIVRYHVWAKMNYEGCVIKSEDTWNHLGEIKVSIANMDTVRQATRDYRALMLVSHKMAHVAAQVQPILRGVWVHRRASVDLCAKASKSATRQLHRFIRNHLARDGREALEEALDEIVALTRRLGGWLATGTAPEALFPRAEYQRQRDVAESRFLNMRRLCF